MARAPTFDLATELAKPSFTPAQRDAPALVELVVGGTEPTPARAASALAVLGDAGRTAIATRLAAAGLDEGGRARLVGALGQLARRGDAISRAAVIDELRDPSSRVRRAAIGGLGHLVGAVRGSSGAAESDVHGALIARWDAADVTPDERRALAEALGKLGGDEALSRLRALAPGDDAELARRRERALLIADRTAVRGEHSEVRVDVAPPRPIAVRLHCKPGLAGMLVDELRALRIEARADGDAAVEIALDKPWSTLFTSRLWMTAGIRVPRPAGDVTGDAARDLTASIVDGLVAQRGLLAAWTRGPIRWRLELPDGKQRAVVWRVARDVTARAPELVNDPTATTWDVLVADGVLELRPRRLVDPRFTYRTADVPAASHPTVAAALAHLGGAQPADRVWDPFVGSGLELVERAKLGPYLSLAGTDLAKPALAAAQANLEAAGVTAALELGDALGAAGERDLELVITNPPLGARVQLDATKLLVDVLPVIARRLVPGGRLVWITPAIRKTTPVAERLGLHRTHMAPIDLGGVRGHVERWELRSRAGAK